jgi:methylenetetrahydrofolate dehydrogenase (NADP+)/methenyltetrahydrofolate cyclohydrolase
MAELLDGKKVAEEITARVREKADRLTAAGILPTLAIIRVGEDPGDMSYERGAKKRAEKAGVSVKEFHFSDDACQEELMDTLRQINRDESIHGLLMLRPLPKHLDEAGLCEMLDPAKDVDGITSGSLAGVFMDTGQGYPPCTAEACMAILDHYGVDLKGMKVVVMGRSLVIGKPVAMMVMKRHATITMLHSRTREEDFRAAARDADIIIAAMGRAKAVGSDQLGEDQILIDVGINMDDEGRLCGDIDPDAAESRAKSRTPVPGGVGSVTTAILMKHVVEAAEKV